MKYILGILAVVALLGLLYLMKGPAAFDMSTYVRTPIQTVSTLQYGDNELKVGEVAYFPDLNIEPTRVTEDSRCPASVLCIQAGTVRVEFRIASSMGTSTAILGLGETLTTGAETITFTDVTPAKEVPGNIAESKYGFLVNISKQDAK